jgi:hypothetical protein
MTTLKNLKGTAIQYLAEDPVEYAGTWASSTSSNSPREEFGAGGTATSTIVFGGQQSPSASPRTRGETETWNGSAWTEVADLNTVKKNQAGAGTPTSALSSSGQDPGNTNSPLVEQWNGSAWTEVAEVNTARRQLVGAGTSGTAALIFFGFDGSFTNVCESWNGSAWTEVGDTNTGRVRAGSFGTYTSAIGAGGYLSASTQTSTNAESWNGSAWTEVGDLNTARKDMSSHGSGGSNTDGLIFAGYSGSANLTSTEFWNGTSWTEVNDLSTGFRNGFGSQQGSSASAIAGIGFSTTYGTQVEEWSFPAITATIVEEGQLWFNSSSSVLKGYGTAAGIPAATWSTGGNMNTARYSNTGAGIQTAALSFGGATPSRTAANEEYDGSSWTEVGDLNSARNELGGSGTQTAAIGAGGAMPPGVVGVTETWNGSTWTEVGDLNTARSDLIQSIGTQTANLLAGGSGATAKTESWNGSAWTEVNDLNTGRATLAETGIQTAAAVMGGYVYPTPGYQALHEQWDGTSWTELADINDSRQRFLGTGQSQDSIIVAGGDAPGNVTKTEFWNGSSWTELNDMATARYSGSATPASGATSSIFAGGYTTTAVATTEEWTADTIVNTVTTS